MHRFVGVSSSLSNSAAGGSCTSNPSKTTTKRRLSNCQAIPMGEDVPATCSPLTNVPWRFKIANLNSIAGRGAEHAMTSRQCVVRTSPC